MFYKLLIFLFYGKMIKQFHKNNKKLTINMLHGIIIKVIDLSTMCGYKNFSNCY